MWSSKSRAAASGWAVSSLSRNDSALSKERISCYPTEMYRTTEETLCTPAATALVARPQIRLSPNSGALAAARLHAAFVCWLWLALQRCCSSRRGAAAQPNRSISTIPLPRPCGSATATTRSDFVRTMGLSHLSSINRPGRSSRKDRGTDACGAPLAATQGI